MDENFEHWPTDSSVLEGWWETVVIAMYGPAVG